jgi:putative flippase GtrA
MQNRTATSLLARHRLEVKFVLIGAWNTVFAILVFIGLDTIFTHVFSRRYAAYMCAMALTNILSITNAFILHKYFTFRSRARGMSLVMEFIRFFSTYAFVFALSLLLLPVLAEGFHIAPKVSAVFGIIISILVSYVGHSRFSFRREDRIG